MGQISVIISRNPGSALSANQHAWKAQSRLTARYRMLSARGKRTTVVCTAIARELVGFMWAVAREARTT
jgi:hypothetical protein